MDFRTVGALVMVAFGLFAAAATVLRRPLWLAGALVVALSLGGFNAYATSTVWTPSKVVAAFIVVYLLLMDHDWAPLVARYAAPFVVFVFAVVVSTLVAYLIEPSFTGDSAAAQSRYARPLVQAYAYISAVASVPLLLVAVRTRAQFDRLMAVYAYTAVAASLIAVVQLALVSSGRAFLPILRMTGKDSKTAAFQIGPLHVERLYALSGEPKMLAAFLIPACCMVFVALMWDRQRRPGWARWDVMALLLIVTLLTFSTAGLLALVVALPCILLRAEGVRVGAVGRLLLVGVATMVMAGRGVELAAGRSAEDYPSHNRPTDVLYARSFGRLTEEGDSRTELRALSLIVTEHPEGLALGLGPGMYNFYLPGLHWGAGIEPIDSGWTALLVDLGAFGAAVLAFWIWTAAKRPRAGARAPATGSGSGDWNVGGQLAAAGLIASACVHLGWGTMAFLGVFLGAAAVCRRHRSLVRREHPAWEAEVAPLPADVEGQIAHADSRMRLA